MGYPPLAARSKQEEELVVGGQMCIDKSEFVTLQQEVHDIDSALTKQSRLMESMNDRLHNTTLSLVGAFAAMAVLFFTVLWSITSKQDERTTALTDSMTVLANQQTLQGERVSNLLRLQEMQQMGEASRSKDLHERIMHLRDRLEARMEKFHPPGGN